MAQSEQEARASLTHSPTTTPKTPSKTLDNELAVVEQQQRWEERLKFLEDRMEAVELERRNLKGEVMQLRDRLEEEE